MNLQEIDTSYWKIKDKAWMAERKANWLKIEDMFAAKSSKGVSPIKQYYLKGKMPNWDRFKDWENTHRHLDILCFLWLHPSWDEQVLTELRDAYMGSELTIEDDIAIGLRNFMWSVTYAASYEDEEDQLTCYPYCDGHNALLFKVLMGDLNEESYEIQGYTTGDPVIMFGHKKRFGRYPKCSVSHIAYMAQWLCLKRLFPINEDMIYQYDQPLEWWYQSCIKEPEYFKKNNSSKSLKSFNKAFYRIHHFDTEKEGDTCRTRFVIKLRNMFDERDFFPDFKQMWEDVKSGKTQVESPWEM